MAQLKTETSEPVYVEIGERIRQLRSTGGPQKLTQEELARQVDLTRASIANIELGRQKVFAHTLLQIAFALGVAPADLLPDDVSIVSDNRANYAGTGLSESQRALISEARRRVKS